MIDDAWTRAVAALVQAIDSVPAGAWAVGVSGGADSVALLRLLHTRNDLRFVVAHLNHQTRGQESDADEAFVAALCRELHVEFRSARRDEIEARLGDSNLPANPSARYRQLRFEHFRDVIERQQLQGVILAHHADDQAETIFQRLLRGGGYSSIAGMSACATIGGVHVLRPMLKVPRELLRAYLAAKNFAWREDASNASPDYQRNRLRLLMRDRPQLADELLELARTCSALRAWSIKSAPVLAAEFNVNDLASLPSILSRQATSVWLREREVPAELIDRNVTDRLIEMCTDAASAARQQFPGGVMIRRRAGRIFADDQRG